MADDTRTSASPVCPVCKGEVGDNGISGCAACVAQSLELTSCDFVGDSGCIDPDCWRCHSPLSPTNLRTLAANLADAAMLCRAWQMRDDNPSWRPGCKIETKKQEEPYR